MRNRRRIRPGCTVAVAILLMAGVAVRVDAQGVAQTSRRPAAAKPLPPGVTPPALQFVDLAAQAGLSAITVSGDPTKKNYILETTGTGVAIFDFDNDGLPDILQLSASRFEKGPKLSHTLYRNLGGLRFEAVPEAGGIRHLGWAQGVCAGDFDNDGWVDVVVPHYGPLALYRNDRGRFVEESAIRGLGREGNRWSTGCAFLDYDRDGHLDLFVANYLKFDPAKTPKPGETAECRWRGLPVLCGPRGLPGESMSLYRNDGKGKFVDVTEAAGISTEPHYYGFTPLTLDFDNDGWPDIYVACDSTASLLFHNRGDGTFEEVGLFSATAFNEDGMEQAGMGVAAADYDGDGLVDIFKTNFSNDTHTLYRNQGDGAFLDVTISAGLAVNTQYVGWGTAFLDIDHDGRPDLLAANGHVYPEVDKSSVDERFRQPRLVYWNRGDRHFHDISASAGPGIDAAHSSRGLATADLDQDGVLEAVIVNLDEPLSLLKNRQRPAGRSLLIRALTASGRDAIGARVTIAAAGKSQFGEVRSGGFHISQGDFRVHFGIGDAQSAELTIRWPDGSTNQYGSIPAEHVVTVRQGQGIVSRTPFIDGPVAPVPAKERPPAPQD